MLSSPIENLGDFTSRYRPPHGECRNLYQIVAPVRHHDMEVRRRMVRGPHLDTAVWKSGNGRHLNRLGQSVHWINDTLTGRGYSIV